jgi:hypothetical protein
MEIKREVSSSENSGALRQKRQPHANHDRMALYPLMINNILADHRIRTEPRASFHEGLDDPRVGVEQVIPRHPGLPRHPGGDHHHVGARECLLESGVPPHREGNRTRQRSRDRRAGRNVGQVRGDAGRADDVVARQLGYLRRELAQEGQGLADPAGGAEDCHLRLGGGCGGEREGVSSHRCASEGAGCGVGGEAIEDHRGAVLLGKEKKCVAGWAVASTPSFSMA